jgi:POTRA domain, FtsQ-type/Cell division protein FtsQ/DivIB, C-terminal
MGIYQGRALRQEARAVRRGGGIRLRRWLHVFAGMLVIALLAHVPWSDLRHRFAVLTDVDVRGLRYLGAADVRHIAGLEAGQDLFALDLERARQALRVHPRIAAAEVHRAWMRRLQIQVTERLPVLLVQHGAPWEMDSSGVLLEPLDAGAVADVPLLTGAGLESMPPGAEVHTPEVRRGLAWAEALARPDLQLSGRVSEIDVSESRTTALVLSGGTRVLSPAWPPDMPRLTALRVVLADLEKRGTRAEEVDLRFEHQIIVRPVTPLGGDAAAARRT